ncbi:hypothetical protein OAP22_00460 [Candidatus Pelagibacter ubique]|nr:hypothetical protein [Candidatus Pelagibacter ubique]
MIKNKNTLALFLFIPAGLLIISNLVTFDSEFYVFIKMIICFTSVAIIFYGFKSAKGINETIVIFSLILILFNPVFPILLEKELWLLINLLTSGIYIYGYFNVLKNSKISSSKKFEEDRELFELINR